MVYKKNLSMSINIAVNLIHFNESNVLFYFNFFNSKIFAGGPLLLYKRS